MKNKPVYVSGISICLVVLTSMWSLTGELHAQEPTNNTNREALVATIEKLKQLPIEKYLEVGPVELQPAKSTLTCERSGYRTATEKRNRAWEFFVDSVRDSKTGEFYVGFPCDSYVKIEAGIAGISFSSEGLFYVLPSWLEKQEVVADHKAAWKAFENRLTFSRLEAATEEAVFVPFPGAIFKAHMATSAFGLPVEMRTLEARGHALIIGFLAKNTNDESILKVDTSKTPWRITSARLNGAAIDIAPLEMKLREGGAGQPATAGKSQSESVEKPKPQSEVRPR